MTDTPVFPAAELEGRLSRVREAMRARGLDGLLVTVPENIYYLTGLDHWGFFACHLLVVPAEGEMILCARDMEGVTFRNQVANAQFHGHADDEPLAVPVTRALSVLGLTGARLGIEKRSLFLTLAHAEAIFAAVPGAAWEDASGLIDDIRLVKSPLEQAYTRRAAEAADAGTMAAVAAIGDGASDCDVAAECLAAMTRAGSEYPGFGPFIRPTSRLGEEHTTWRGHRFRAGEAVLLEIGAAYRKYQAPMGRLVHVGHAPPAAEAAAELAAQGMAAILGALRPGATAGEVYAAWARAAAEGGLADYHRHHCGYLVGIGFPPSWTGGSMVTSLAPGSGRVLAEGMVVHAQSWFTETGRGPEFSHLLSNTVLLTGEGAEVLTPRTPAGLQLR